MDTRTDQSDVYIWILSITIFRLLLRLLVAYTRSVLIFFVRWVLISDDPRETSLLFQRLSVSIQRFNTTTHLETLQHIFLTSRDATRVL